MKLTKDIVLSDILSLGENRKTADVDRLIRKYIKAGADASGLREHILAEQSLHRVYYFVSLMQIKDPLLRIEFIDKNLLFSDWWHSDQIIKFVCDVESQVAISYAEKYIKSGDSFIRRWGYVMLIFSHCRKRENLERILEMLKNEQHYTVQMAEAWLICEMAIYFPEEMLAWFKNENNLHYNINSKAIQKICDSFRVTVEIKERFKALRSMLKNREER